jgi:hypothetical protein
MSSNKSSKDGVESEDTIKDLSPQDAHAEDIKGGMTLPATPERPAVPGAPGQPPNTNQGFARANTLMEPVHVPPEKPRP